MSEEPYLVWSNEHRAWWRPNSCGYTVHSRAAGLYSKDEAVSISHTCRDGWPEHRAPSEIAVPLSVIPEGQRPVTSEEAA